VTGAAGRALLVENIHDRGVRVLADAGFEVVTRGGALDEDELIAALDGVDYLGIRSTTFVTKRVLELRPQLKAIGAFCIGTNQVDLDAAAERGVAVFNAPYSNTRSVVEMAIAEIITMARRLYDRSADMHRGQWNKSAAGSHELRGRTLGIVGYGSIGSQLSVVAEAMGMNVWFYDIDDKLAIGNARRCATLDELLAGVDVVSLHVDGRAGNAGFFSREQFAAMKPGALFLNLSRGLLIDQRALRDALVSGMVGGAALDVFEDEPRARKSAWDSPLRGLENVILTPHVAGSTQEAQEDIGRFVAGKLVDYAQRGTSQLNVNLPQCSVGTVTVGSRVLHLHDNRPGVLAEIGTILGAAGLNVTAQQLTTHGSTGYAVSDLDTLPSRDTLQQLGDIDGTRRLRVVTPPPS